MDRFSVGIADPQEMGAAFISKCGCGGKKCRDNIYAGDECWEYDGDYFSSEICLLWAIGANRVVAGTEENC